MIATNQGPDIDAIKPDGEGSKYSPNLYKWLKVQPRPDLIKVLADENGTLMIGHVDNDYGDGAWLHGARLISVLCEGSRAKSFAHAIGNNFLLTEIPDFWERYTEIGRCAIDPKHEIGFMGDSTRWKEDGDWRHCLWCGKHRQRRYRWTEKVEREKWEPVIESTKGRD